MENLWVGMVLQSKNSPHKKIKKGAMHNVRLKIPSDIHCTHKNQLTGNYGSMENNFRISSSDGWKP